MNVTPADLSVGDVVTIHRHGEPQQCFCVTETGERFRVRPAVDADYPSGFGTGPWPRLWLDLDTVTYEQLGGTDECHVCAGKMHDNVLLTVPGEAGNDDDSCHCGHGWGDHSFHVLFCCRCNCDSYHHPGENNDQITERWN